MPDTERQPATRPPDCPPDAPSAGRAPRFVTGSILRHILVMTGTGALGLMAIFIGDLANIFFLGRLGDVEVVAAVGYAAAIQFFSISVGIGLAIATASLVAPAIGARDMATARRLAASAHVFAAVFTALVAAALWVATPWLLMRLGAGGRTLALATGYLRVVLPSLPVLAVAMASSAALRSAGDPRRAMYVTLAGAVVNIALDPPLIFGLGLGIDGAAWASAISRFAAMAIGLLGVVRAHHLIAWPSGENVIADARAIGGIALPAVLANVATPVANAYVTAAIAPFGDSAVAGWAIIGRTLPVAFGAIYALSGSIGPVLGQNLGAREFARVRAVLSSALWVSTGFTLLAWLVLVALTGPLVRAFGADGLAAELIELFCRWVAPLFAFLGALFVANAAFNVLGRPHLATAFNWSRATLGTVPFVEIGSRLAGAQGVVAGNMIGAIPFGIAAVVACYWLIGRLAHADARRANTIT